MKMAQGIARFKLKVLLWAIFISGVANLAQAADSSYWLCRRAMEVRTLRVDTSETSCVAWYTKDGLDEKVADSKDAALCSSIVLRIKNTLQSAGWKCTDISSSQISH
jgi:hypothetical protein